MPRTSIAVAESYDYALDDSRVAAPAANLVFISKYAPLASCLFAGVVLAFTPVIVWRVITGSWVCLKPN